jgi:type I restriction enzyme S subunit
MLLEGWSVVTLRQICLATTGLQTGPFGSQLHASDYVVDGTPVVMPKDLVDGVISTATIARISFDKVKEVAKHSLQLGDLVFSRRGELGRFAVVQSENVGWICGTGCLRARLKASICPEFIYAQLSTSENISWLEANAVGQTMPNLNVEILSRLPLRLPPLAQQRQIAEIVSTWDRGIRQLTDLISAKFRFRRGLMQMLLTGKWRFKGFSDGWWKVHLKDVTDECQERNRGRLGTESVMAVTKIQGIVPMRERTIAADIDRYSVVKKDCFAYNPMRLNIGSIARWSGDNDVLVSPDYVVFCCKEATGGSPAIDSDFLDQYRRSSLWERYVTSSGNGSVRVRIYFDDLGRMKLSLPSLKEQKRIATVLDTADRELEILRRELEALKTQKSGLIQKLLTGQVSATT